MNSKTKGGATLIMGAGCSLEASANDITTVGIMKESLREHGVPIDSEKNWEIIYQKFIDCVWNTKREEEQRELLKKRLASAKPTKAHFLLKELIEAGFITKIITTNFDMLVEKTCSGMSYIKKAGDNDFVKVGANATTFKLLNVHGDLESGKLRFSPAELKRLPNDIVNEIKVLTNGLTIFIGYRGQDVGLMNAIDENSASSLFWVDPRSPYNQNFVESQMITELLSSRGSSNNILYGDEYGKFQNIIQELHSMLVLRNHQFLIDAQKQRYISFWNNTEILKKLSVNARFYNLFVDIVYCSRLLCKKHNFDEKLYEAILKSYLYVLQEDILPNSLKNATKNEIDALLIGCVFEMFVGSYTIDMDVESYEEALISIFHDEVYSSVLFDNSFWSAIDRIINPQEYNEGSSVKFNFINDNLNIESIKIQFKNISSLILIAQILSALNYPYQNEMSVFYGKTENIKCFGDIIHLDLNEIKSIEKSFITNNLINKLPSKNTVVIDERTQIISKWMEITYTVKKEEYNNESSLFDVCIELCRITAKNFVDLDKRITRHVKLNLDYDINNFLLSNKIGMFITGTSGSGKTSAVRNFIIENQNWHYSIVSSQINQSLELQLSSFIGAKIDEDEEESVLLSIEQKLNLEQSLMIFIIDGINELEYQSQLQYYVKVIQLAKKIEKLNCNHIRIIITCREHAYLNYKEQTKMYLDFSLFYRNDKFEYGIAENQDANYRVKPCTDEELSALANCYLSNNVIISELINNKNNITPFYFSIIQEYIKNYNPESLSFIDYDDIFYEILSKNMIKRLSKTNQLLSKNILYAYFDLVLESQSEYITKFMLRNRLFNHYEKYSIDEIDNLDNMVNALIDVNILSIGFSKIYSFKFYHDKIEEYFFETYLIECLDTNDMPSIDNLLNLCKKNLIYQEGFLRFLRNMLQQSINDYKKIVINCSLNHMAFLSKLVIASISTSKDYPKDLNFLLHDRDYDGSKSLINIIIIGLENALTAYSLLNYDLLSFIDSILCVKSSIITNDIKAYMYYFKSRVFYFRNDYDSAAQFVEKSLTLVNEENHILYTKLQIHRAVILIELGNSNESIKVLRPVYDSFNTLDNNVLLKIRIGIELGRALNHVGNINEPLELYDELLMHKDQITQPYILARIYEQKGNSLNKIMFENLDYGMKPSSSLDEDGIKTINKLFNEAVQLYKKAMELLISENEVFCYSGVLPELINTYMSYSMSVQETGIEECKSLIDTADLLFENITTPFKTDFYLAKAYYYEYIGETDEAYNLIQKAINNAKTLNIQNKEAKSNLFLSQFVIRQIQNNAKMEINTDELKQRGLTAANNSFKYYNLNNSDIANNCNARACMQTISILTQPN